MLRDRKQDEQEAILVPLHQFDQAQQSQMNALVQLFSTLEANYEATSSLLRQDFNNKLQLCLTELEEAASYNEEELAMLLDDDSTTNIEALLWPLLDELDAKLAEITTKGFVNCEAVQNECLNPDQSILIWRNIDVATS